MFTKQVWPGGQSGSPIVAARAQQVERTRRKTCSRAESEFLCPSGVDAQPKMDEALAFLGET
jgi:hypothetical protein